VTEKMGEWKWEMGMKDTEAERPRSRVSFIPISHFHSPISHYGIFTHRKPVWLAALSAGDLSRGDGR
jgi:hypothetical protein